MWIWSSLTAIAICSTKKADSRGNGNDAKDETDAGFVELMWWNDGMRLNRRTFVTPSVYFCLSFDRRWCRELGRGSLEEESP